MARKRGSTARMVSREISRASKKARPETDHYKALNAAISKTKKKLHGPTAPSAYIEVSSRAPRSPQTANKIEGKLVRRRGRG